MVVMVFYRLCTKIKESVVGTKVLAVIWTWLVQQGFMSWNLTLSVWSESGRTFEKLGSDV